MPKNFWNIVSVVLPLVTAVVAVIGVKTSRPSGGNLGSALAPFFFFGIVLWAVCVAGALCATVALIRGEDKLWLSLLGLFTNLAVVIGGLMLIVPRE